MRIEVIANLTTPWYFMVIPTVVFFYDKEEQSAGMAVMWLNGMAGLQVINKTTIKDKQL